MAGALLRLVSRFDIFPNPNEGAFMIEIALRESIDGKLMMVDLSGSKVFLMETLTARKEYSFQTAFQNIPAGLYFLILRVEDKIYNKRIMIR